MMILVHGAPFTAVNCLLLLRNVSKRNTLMKDSTFILAEKQVTKSFELMFAPGGDYLDSQVSHRHTYLHMPSWVSKDGSSRTCIPAMGASFGGGTSDGPGAPAFQQGTSLDYVNENFGGDDWVWFKIRDLLSKYIFIF